MPLMNFATSEDSKSDIIENEELIKILQTAVDGIEDNHFQLLKQKNVSYEPEDMYYVSPEMYEKNMKFLYENGYTTITLKDFIKNIRNGTKFSFKLVLIYSDTTSSWFYDMAFPILKKYNFTATIGVEIALINTSGQMNIAQLAELEDYGIEISCHSISHPDLTSINETQLKQEIYGSKQYLENWGFNVETFIYPYGAYNDRVIQAVKDAGYIGARAVGGPHLSDGGGYASYSKALLYEIKAALPVNITTISDFRKYILNSHIEIEDICSVYNEAGNDFHIERVVSEEDNGFKNDSFASMYLHDKNDAINFTIYVPQSDDYDLHFRVKTGEYVSEYSPNTDEDAYEYIVNGQSYTTSNATVKTTGSYENESTNNIVWGYQHIYNISLKEGANDIIIISHTNWSVIVDYLIIDSNDKTDEIIRHTIPSIDYDGIYKELTTEGEEPYETQIILAMHGYEHQNPNTGSFSDEFKGLSISEDLERLEKSHKIFKKAKLKPMIFIPPGGELDETLNEALKNSNITMLDLNFFEGTWMWRDMTSSDDPRFTKTLTELEEMQTSEILIHMQDYNKYTKKVLEDYINSEESPDIIILRVDDINVQTSGEQMSSLLNFRNNYADRMTIILGVTPLFYKNEEETGLEFIFVTLWMLFLITVIFLDVFFICIATVHIFQIRRKKRRYIIRFTDQKDLPKVSIIIPMFNEGELARTAIQCAQNQTYPGPIEIIVIDDGSSDNTFDIIRSEASKYPNIIGLRQSNKGKPAALNNGVKVASGDIVISTDGDSFLEAYAVESIVEKFLDDPEIGAIAGFIKVSNETESWITKFSQLEYIKEQALYRGCQSFTGDVVICPGAIFAAYKHLLEKYPSSNRTVVEDCDQTCLVRKSGWKVSFDPNAISRTKAPSTFKGWKNQRLRWLYGYLQVWQLLKNFAIKKPWMIYAYMGYPLVFLTFITMIIPLTLLCIFSESRFLISALFYTMIGLCFTFGVYIYTIKVLTSTTIKKRLWPWIILFPFYATMVMVLRMYLYIKYLRKDGPIMKYGPRVIHALPDQSVTISYKALSRFQVIASDIENKIIKAEDWLVVKGSSRTKHILKIAKDHEVNAITRLKKNFLVTRFGRELRKDNFLKTRPRKKTIQGKSYVFYISRKCMWQGIEGNLLLLRDEKEKDFTPLFTTYLALDPEIVICNYFKRCTVEPHILL